MADELEYRVGSLEQRMDRSDEERRQLMKEIKNINSKFDDHQKLVENRLLESQQIMTRIDTTIKTTGKLLGGLFSGISVAIAAIALIVGF